MNENAQYPSGVLPSQQMQNNWNYMRSQQPWNQPMAAPQPMPEPPQIIVVSVSSTEEAERFPVAPGRTVFLIDYTNRQFWLKRKDEMGLMSTFIHHTFVADGDTPQPGETADLVTRTEFEALKKTVDDLLK